MENIELVMCWMFNSRRLAAALLSGGGPNSLLLCQHPGGLYTGQTETVLPPLTLDDLYSDAGGSEGRCGRISVSISLDKYY